MHANLPFPRGRGFHNTGAAIATADYAGPGIAMEGRVCVAAAEAPGTPVTRRSGGDDVLMVVRNASGANLLPKHLTTWAAGYRGRRVGAYSLLTAAEIAGVVDEFWPAAGVPNGELFYIVLKGLTLAKTGHTAGAGNVISEAGPLVALTAAGTTADDAGHLSVQDLTGEAAALGNQIQNAFARALSANTTNQTDRDLLVDVCLY